MKSGLRLTGIIFLFTLTAYSQIPSIEWDARFGGGGADEPFAIHQTSDGGYIVGGYSNSPADGDKSQNSQGGNDYWIMKTGTTCAKRWDKRFGGSLDDELFSMQQTTDG